MFFQAMCIIIHDKSGIVNCLLKKIVYLWNSTAKWRIFMHWFGILTEVRATAPENGFAPSACFAPRAVIWAKKAQTNSRGWGAAKYFRKFKRKRGSLIEFNIFWWKNHKWLSMQKIYDILQSQKAKTWAEEERLRVEKMLPVLMIKQEKSKELRCCSAKKEQDYTICPPNHIQAICIGIFCNEAVSCRMCHRVWKCADPERKNLLGGRKRDQMGGWMTKTEFYPPCKRFACTFDKTDSSPKIFSRRFRKERRTKK